jgi:ABC-type transport system involved in multi-copper enzyme maturation permease subunit
MPTLAITGHELRALAKSWLVRLWLIAAALATFFTTAGNWTTMESAVLIATLQIPFLVFPWFLVVIMLGISPVTGVRLDALADGILSRPVTRHEFLLAAWLARLVTVLAVYLCVSVPAILLITYARRPVPADDLSLYGVLVTLGVVSLVLMLLVSLAFCAGTLLRQPLLAAVVLMLIWFPLSLVLHTFSLEEFSPISLNQALPTVLQTPWRTADVAAEPGPRAEDLESLARQTSQFLSILSGGATPAREPQGSFLERGDYDDFSVPHIVLGYGIPAVAALGLSLLVFSRRDL